MSAVPSLSRAPHTWRASLVAIATAAALIVGMSAPSPASAATRTTSTVGVSSKLVNPGTAVTVTGAVRVGSTPVAGVWAKLQWRIHGTSTWTTIHTARTNSQGKITFRTTGLQRDYDFRTVYSGGDGRAASSSAPVTTYVKQTARITETSSLTPTAGTAITIKGVTSAGLRGNTAVLEFSKGGVWFTAATSKVANDSTFKLQARTLEMGKKQWRVRVVGGTGESPAVTSTKQFTTYAWIPLDYKNDLGRSGTYRSDDYYGGIYHSNSIRQGYYTNPAYIEYNLGYACSTFNARAGQSDTRSASGSTGVLTVKIDSITALTRGTTLGATSDVTVNLDGGLRLRLEMDSVTGNAIPGFASPRIRCWAEPAS